MVEGRLDNLFISGENIQPETIEQRLVDHPAVAQALVVPVPSDEWGHRPAAFIDWHDEPAPCRTGRLDQAVVTRLHGAGPVASLAGSRRQSETLPHPCLARSLRQEE